MDRYRDYMDPNYRHAFDAFMTEYRPLWMSTRARDEELPETWSRDFQRDWMAQDKVAVAAEAVWNPSRRLQAMDSDGVVADVLFPDEQSFNPPPFYLFNRDHRRPFDKEFAPDVRRAGARAYNRWLAEYCSADSDRLLGVALVGSVADVNAAIDEVRWAKENGLKGGIALPLIYYNTAGEPFYNDRRYDPLWAACAEMGMPLHTHNGPGCPSYGDAPEAPLLFAVECTYWPHRPLWFLTFGGAFERHPDLRLIMTEQGSAWTLETLSMMDHFVTHKKYAAGTHKHLKLKPSEYFARQCWLGASIVHPTEIARRHAIGLNKMMWGWDYPHLEAADWLTPKENLRALLNGVPENEVRAIIGQNAVAAFRLDLAKLQPVAERLAVRPSDIVGQ
jgi:predicted TIM-barrel fold metal-dependent hydrolase